MPLKKPLGLAIVEEDANIEAWDRQQYFNFHFDETIDIVFSSFFLSLISGPKSSSNSIQHVPPCVAVFNE